MKVYELRATQTRYGHSTKFVKDVVISGGLHEQTTLLAGRARKHSSMGGFGFVWNKDEKFLYKAETAYFRSFKLFSG